MEKIFCLGSNKTGTVSLRTAMKNLGFKISTSQTHGLYFHSGLIGASQEEFKRLFDIIKKRKHDWNFFADMPFNLPGAHEILYNMFPNSRFVLTIRDPEKWFETVLRWIQTRNAQKIYDWIWCTEFTPENKQEILTRYNRRNSGIINFFKNKNLLTLYIGEDNNALQKLCAFVGKDTISGPFPHENINHFIKKNESMDTKASLIDHIR